MFDVIVVGGGHAGCEASMAASGMGAQTVLITSDITKIAQMSCNPSIGGIGKGQIVREIDALGGWTGRIADRTTLQFRMLNRSKGPAMHSPRAQCDRELFTYEWRKVLEQRDNLVLIQDSVIGFIIEKGECLGVRTRYKGEIRGRRVILTAGTFLNGLIHIGMDHMPGGRIDEAAAPFLSEELEQYGIRKLRFKTGTSARIDLRSIDIEKVQVQPGDEKGGRFSYNPNYRTELKQLPCYITYTNSHTHRIIAENLDQSPLYRKIIHGRGPRYCPSIEDKIHMFPGKESHPIFLEPESATGHQVYINGLSSSLPYPVQEEALHSIVGLEHAHIIRPGYAIEYDFFDPTQLEKTLESKIIQNLFIAGQMNGTTGYEEAGAQGLIAGINAVHSIRNRPGFVLSRNEAYIGVMIDDLTTNGVDEPYRMFTSRAESRLLLRQDNADERLMGYGKEFGLIEEEEYLNMKNKYDRINEYIKWIKTRSVTPDEINEYLNRIGSSEIQEKIKLDRIILRPEVHIWELQNILDIKSNTIPVEEIEIAELKIKYANYLKRNEEEIVINTKLDKIKLTSQIQNGEIEGVSRETLDKLQKYKPNTIGELRAIPGIKISDISRILLAVK